MSGLAQTCQLWPTGGFCIHRVSCSDANTSEAPFICNASPSGFGFTPGLRQASITESPLSFFACADCRIANPVEHLQELCAVGGRTMCKEVITFHALEGHV
jgi:hypothetical protein